jgi:hypothetical protein
MSENVKMNKDAKYTSFVLHIAAEIATHARENANVEIDVSKLLHILQTIY